VRSPLLPIFLVVLVDVLGMTLMIPLLPFYAEHFGASPLEVGSLQASFAVCQLVAGPILGRISDRVGRKQVLLVTQVGTFFGFLLIGNATALWMLFVGRIIDGVTAGNLSIAQAYISDVTKPEERTKSFALIGISFGLGFLVGPAISGVLATKYGLAAPAYAAAAASFLSILVTTFVLPKVTPKVDASAPRRGFVTHFLAEPVPRRRFIQFFLFILSFATLVAGLPLFLERQLNYDVAQVGYVYAFSGIVGLIVQGGLIGRLVKHLGERRLSLVGFASMAVGYSMLGFATDLPRLLALMVIGGFGSAVTRPALTTLVTKAVGRNEQGAALGLTLSLSSIAQIVGPLVANSLIGVRALTAYGLTAGVVAALGAVMLAIEPNQPEPVP
jgi:MFS family permease